MMKNGGGAKVDEKGAAACRGLVRPLQGQVSERTLIYADEDGGIRTERYSGDVPAVLKGQGP
jgi:hypothetical protein